MVGKRQVELVGTHFIVATGHHQHQIDPLPLAEDAVARCQYAAMVDDVGRRHDRLRIAASDRVEFRLAARRQRNPRTLCQQQARRFAADAG